MIFGDFLMFFHEKPLKTYTGARSTKIMNLQFFSSAGPHAGLPRVSRCFEKVILLDFRGAKVCKP